MLSLRLSGVLLLRYEHDRFSGLSLFQEPPRNTRFGHPRHFRHGCRNGRTAEIKIRRRLASLAGKGKG
jgi:hypothetical protein